MVVGGGGCGQRVPADLNSQTIFNFNFFQKLSNLETSLDMLWLERSYTSLFSERDVSIAIIF